MNWLEKNKDPLNDSCVAVIKTTTVSLIQEVWQEYTTQEETQKDYSEVELNRSCSKL